MQKSTLRCAIAISLGLSSNQVLALDVTIDNMMFGSSYAAEGTFRDDSNDFGFIQGNGDFAGAPWSAIAVVYFEPGLSPTFDNDFATDENSITNGTSPTTADDPIINGTFSQTGTDNGFGGAGTMYTWSGTADQLTSPGGAATFTYNFTLTANEIAWGTLFNWNGASGIPVLMIMDCLSTPGTCTGRGTTIPTTPFPGQAPSFSGDIAALSCPDLFISTSLDLPISIDKTEFTINCSGGLGDIVIGSIDTISTFGGTIIDTGSSVTFNPVIGSQGTDSFDVTLIDDLFTDDIYTNIFLNEEQYGNFTIMQPDGQTFGGANDVVFIWDQETFNTDESDTNFDIMRISFETTFFGVEWNNHHIRVYDGGATGRALQFDTTCSVAELETGATDCGGTLTDIMKLDIPAGMYGAHILVDWHGNKNIDVVNVWETDEKWYDDDGIGGKNDLYQGAMGVIPHRDAYWTLVSRDVNGDGINGAPMIDGPFPDNYVNFNWNPTNIKPCEVFGLVTDPDTGDCVDELTNNNETETEGDDDNSLSALSLMNLFVITLLLLGRKPINTLLNNNQIKL